MVVQHQLSIDLSRHGVTPQIDAVQDDKYTRDLVLHLYSGGVPWEPPSGATVITRYVKRDGVGGTYDTMPDGALAYSISRNMVTVKLAPQVLTVAGPVRINVGIISGTEEISTFEIRIHVRPNVAAEVADSEYYQNITGFMPLPKVAKVGQYFRVKEVSAAGVVTAVEAVDAPDGSSSTDVLDVSDLLGYGTATAPIDMGELDIASNDTIYFPAGVYYIQPLDITGVENLTILAEGAQLILTGDYLITGRECHDFKMVGGLIDGRSNAVYGIQLIDSQSVSFEDVYYCSFGNTSRENVSMLNLFGDCSNFLVDRCSFVDSTAGVISSDGFIHAYGLFVNRLGSSKTYSKSGLIRQCEFSEIAGTDNGGTKADGDAIFIQAPPYLDGNGDLVIPNAQISIENCMFENCKKRGIKVAAHGVEIDRCQFDGAFWYAAVDFQYGHGRISRSRLINASDYNGSITSALVASDGGVDVDDCTFSAPYVYVDPDTGARTNTFHPGIRLGKRLGSSVIGTDVAWDPIHINRCRFDGVSRSVFAYNSEGDTTGYTLAGLEITDCEFGEFNQAHAVEINSTMFQKILAYKFVDFKFDYGVNRTEVAAANSKFTYPHTSNCEFVHSFELYSRYWDNEPMSGYNGLPTATHTRIIYAGSGMGSVTYKEHMSRGSLIRGTTAPEAITSTLSKQLLYNSRVGDIYVDTTTGEIYRCTTKGTDTTIGVWTAIGAGGASDGGATDAQVAAAVAAYMDDNPVQDGQSIYYLIADAPTSQLSTLTSAISDLNTNGRTLQVGDLIISQNSVLLKVSSINTTQAKFTASFLCLIGIDTSDANATAADIPDYITTEISAVSDRLKAVQDAHPKSTTFAFLTDHHFHYNSEHLVRHNLHAIDEIAKACRVEFAAYGGDNIAENGNGTVALNKVKYFGNILREYGIRKAMVMGNHDDNSLSGYQSDTGKYLYDYAVPQDQFYAHLYRDNENVFNIHMDAHRDKLYFYVDLPSQQIRVIFLNVIDIPLQDDGSGNLVYAGIHDSGYSDEQLNWVAKDALNFSDKKNPEQWGVITVQHFTDCPEIAAFSNDSYVDQGHGGEVMYNIFKAFNDKSAYYEDLLNGGFSCDFTNAKAELICRISGHTHKDWHVMHDGVLYISTMAAGLNGVGVNQGLDGVTYEKVPDTAEESAFDFFTVDKDSRTIFATRFGAGVDRVMSWAVQETETLETARIVYQQSYNGGSGAYVDDTTFEYTETDTYANYGPTVAKQSTLAGGLLRVNWDANVAKSFGLNIYLFDADGAPYKRAGWLASADAELWSGENYEPVWGDPGDYKSWGWAVAPFSVQIPEGCTCMCAVRYTGDAQSPDGSLADAQAFQEWVLAGGLIFTVTK